MSSTLGICFYDDHELYSSDSDTSTSQPCTLPTYTPGGYAETFNETTPSEDFDISNVTITEGENIQLDESDSSSFNDFEDYRHYAKIQGSLFNRCHRKKIVF